MDNENPKISSSLLNELNDLNGLLDSALYKAKNLDRNFRKGNLSAAEDPPSENDDDHKTPVTGAKRPNSWDNLKNAALEESVSAMEESDVQLANNTKEVRNVKAKTKKLRIDDNWEDDPF